MPLFLKWLSETKNNKINTSVKKFPCQLWWCFFFFLLSYLFSASLFDYSGCFFAKDNDLVFLSLKHDSHKTIIAPCSPIIGLIKCRPASVWIISSSTLYLWEVNSSSMGQHLAQSSVFWLWTKLFFFFF